ncbi:MAG: addiction module toxin RelE [Nanoarchaeota archaeon]|jgi:YafQ family addiction module toxin component|nr:addiction module toxin RelE [Nanoarchaeota archaeon]
MRKFQLSKKLERTLKKLSKKDKLLFERTMDKIDEIVESYDIDNYKNLKKPMNEYKRVHVGSFVLIFRHDKKNDLVFFEDLDHHDFIYKS